MESGFDEGRVVLFYVEGGEEFNERVVRDQILHCVESIWIWNWSSKSNTWKASLDHFELVFFSLYRHNKSNRPPHAVNV